VSGPALTTIAYAVYRTDRAARIAFEVRTRNEVFDFERVLQEYRAARAVRR
jgi:hypothetical protein